MYKEQSDSNDYDFSDPPEKYFAEREYPSEDYGFTQPKNFDTDYGRYGQGGKPEYFEQKSFDSEYGLPMQRSNEGSDDFPSYDDNDNDEDTFEDSARARSYEHDQVPIMDYNAQDRVYDKYVNEQQVLEPDFEENVGAFFRGGNIDITSEKMPKTIMIMHQTAPQPPSHIISDLNGFYSRSDSVTNQDLNPDDFDGNDPYTRDFKMPSHDDLRKNYLPLETSASEIVESFEKIESNGEDSSDPLSNKHG